MRIEQLRSFIAIYETASFTAAAEQLYTSQPAVSRHATQLEEELGGPLFVRTTRQVAPPRPATCFTRRPTLPSRSLTRGSQRARL
ncbi:helix-turn-helix domain-containing protein [Adlercreutzia equolifaciens]|uniref:helix-turn-helix domain-containing protein n=1 Tax=Adlercreutzia equolifaciens TaxID=446660 RepID=UPI0009FF045E|nr:LysR family transcriptional regulator [Adlercreutzia equolifaciens]